MGATRVVIVDDHTLLTEAFRRLLEPDCDVVATYDDPRAFLRDVLLRRTVSIFAGNNVPVTCQSGERCVTAPTARHAAVCAL